MKQTLINIYVLIAAITAISTTVLEIQPALFFINYLAPNPGDKYSLTFVILATCILLLFPLLIFLLIGRFVRNTSNEIIQKDRTGFFVTRQKSFTSAAVGIAVYIDSKKIGVVGNGKTTFFDAPIGTFTLHAGDGRKASEKIEVTILEKDQLRFKLYINKDGLFPKIELILI